MVRSLKAGLIALVAGALLLAGFLWRDNLSEPDPRQALIASLRSEPTTYNRYLASTAAVDLVSLLTDGRLVRVNRSTDAIEPALAERWTVSADGLRYTLALRRDVRFSDGAPFTSADVLFTARVLYDSNVNSQLASAIQVQGQPLVFDAPDDFTVTVSLPSPFAPGLKLLDSMPILPRHKLKAPFDAGKLRDVWRAGSDLSGVSGLGPFTLAEHVSGQRLVFTRNPHYWRSDDRGTRLPYLDRLTVLIIPDQNTEAIRMAAGEIDLMSNGDIRADDYALFKHASDEGRLRLIDAGVAMDPNFLWFNLTPTAKVPEWLRDRRVRQAISFAIDRRAMVDSVYLGAAVPVDGPVTPGNRTWFSNTGPPYPHDPARARQLLHDAGFSNDAASGNLLDSRGKPLRFSILTQKGNTARERASAVIQEQLRQIGITVDVAAVDVSTLRERWMAGAYESIYFGLQASATDPALNSEFWLSSGSFHCWNPSQKTPSTDWEARIDSLMHRQATLSNLEERKQLFAEVVKIIGEELPVIYFVAPKVTIAVSPRVGNAAPVQQAPQLLWAAETLTSANR